MSDVAELVGRIRTELQSGRERLSQIQSRNVEEHHAKLQRAEQLEREFDKLREVWRPRLEALAKELGNDRVDVTPKISPGHRQAEMFVKSPLAKIRLRFTAHTNSDITALTTSYDLDVLPLLMDFERHAEITFPLDGVDPVKLAAWLDDRIVRFVKDYLSMYENEYYLKDHMVQDPVAQVRLPKFAAGATRERDGKTYYFISEETAADFDRQT